MKGSETIRTHPEETESAEEGQNQEDTQGISAPGSDSLRPAARPQVKSYPVADELILLPQGGDRVYALNASGRAIWELLDGLRSLTQIHQHLIQHFDGDPVDIFRDLTTALFRFQALDLLEPKSLSPRSQSAKDDVFLSNSPSSRSALRIVHGIEDNTYFHWQLAIMFESLVGQMPAGWDINVVVCNNHEPISSELAHIFETYQVKYYTGESHADNHHMDFAGGGDRYVPINRVEALNVISAHVSPDDVVCLMDTDIFLYGELQEDLFPKGNAMTANWIVGQERYFQFSTEDRYGLSLPKLLNALGCESEFKPGGVMIFLTGETLQRNDRKVVRDCFRFLQILFLSGRILDLPSHGTWVSEMACFALAMYPNDIDYELLNIEQFAVQDQAADELPQGTFFHYYSDVNDSSNSPGPFRNSHWHKQLFRESSFLKSDIESFLERAEGAAEKQFMKLALQARERLYGQ